MPKGFGGLNNLSPSFERNAIPIMPPLNGGMAGMVKRGGHLADTAEPPDYLRVGFHMPDVRSQRTTVNGENVQALRHKRGMAEDTPGSQLIALRKRSGMTLDGVAAAMKLSGRSSVQRLFVPHLDKLSVDDALKLADAFEGKGKPPIERAEVLALAGVGNLFEVAPNTALAPRYMDLPRDVPVYGTAMGTYRDIENVPEIEQAFIDPSETIDWFHRLPRYAERQGIYGLYVTGTSMEPRLDDGDPIFIDPKRAPQIGDDVVVYLVKPLGDDREPEAVLIKRLVKRSASFVELAQYNPALTFTLETRRISAMHRVIPRREYNGAR